MTWSITLFALKQNWLKFKRFWFQRISKNKQKLCLPWGFITNWRIKITTFLKLNKSFKRWFQKLKKRIVKIRRFCWNILIHRKERLIISKALLKLENLCMSKWINCQKGWVPTCLDQNKMFLLQMTSWCNNFSFEWSVNRFRVMQSCSFAIKHYGRQCCWGAKLLTCWVLSFPWFRFWIIIGKTYNILQTCLSCLVCTCSFSNVY